MYVYIYDIYIDGVYGSLWAIGCPCAICPCATISARYIARRYRGGCHIAVDSIGAMPPI